MEGKLIKSPNGEHYYLTVDGKIFAEIGGHPLKSINQALSLKNCEAVKNGYDLEDLAIKHFGRFGIGLERAECFKAGFQKALEILSDKKFSEKDVRKAIDIAWRNEDSNKIDIIQSLQQTEWEVEIVMEEDTDIFNVCPKLDADGCLILKRK